ncbi:MAG: hypothetical protein ACR2FY_17865 [Pirellulaceae bacterium]
MHLPASPHTILDPESRAFYQSAMRALQQDDVPFLVGGAYSFSRYTGIERHTKDFDVFLREEDVPRALESLARAGYRTELTFPHWLGKAFSGDSFVDIIYGSGNGVARVDDLWFTHSTKSVVLDISALLCPVEETIWSKAFVMERERYDGADIAHLLRARAKELDWSRLLRRFGPHWRVLLSYLTLFGFIYPAERDFIPRWVLDRLVAELQHESHTPPPEEKVCRGTLFSRAQYLVDVENWGYQDARLLMGSMSERDIEHWTAAIDSEPPTELVRPTVSEFATPLRAS